MLLEEQDGEIAALIAAEAAPKPALVQFAPAVSGTVALAARR